VGYKLKFDIYISRPVRENCINYRPLELKERDVEILTYGIEKVLFCVGFLIISEWVSWQWRSAPLLNRVCACVVVLSRGTFCIKRARMENHESLSHRLVILSSTCSSKQNIDKNSSLPLRGSLHFLRACWTNNKLSWIHLSKR